VSRYSPTSIAVAAGVAVALGGAGAAITDIGPWYKALKKPSWQPPDWLFGPAWSLIFALAATAAVLGWHAAGDSPEARLWLVGAFAANAVLNSFWSVLFFRLHRPDWAFAEVIPFWGTIVALIAIESRLSATAAWLLVPYVLWVSFAAYLNFVVVRLNAPFPPR
jgi:tryptophan-rich sensory protein